VARSQSRCVLIAVAACLSLTAPGCHFHRMDHGLVVHSHWSLIFDNTDQATVSDNDKHCEALSSHPVATQPVATQPVATHPVATQPVARHPASPEAPSSASVAGQDGAKPELLSRLRSHRLANRFARLDAEGEKKPPAATNASGLAATDSRRWHMPPATPPVMPKSPHDAERKVIREAEKPTFPVKPAGLQLPNSALTVPESSRPDLVLD
jgi:hypothetical protein